MPSLKELRGRITGVKSTRKITNAMKMVAASKLRRAQIRAEAARPYAETSKRMMGELASTVQGADVSSLPRLMVGTGKDQTHLLIVMTSDRGLAGGFNANLVRKTRQYISELQEQGKTVKLLPVGRKGAEVLARYYPEAIVETMTSDGGQGASFEQAISIASHVVKLLDQGEIDCCTLLRNRFVNAMTQVPEQFKLVPLPASEEQAQGSASGEAHYEFEPNEETLLAQLLPRNLEVQLFAALLESAAGEHAARMTAMDNASRNASKAIDSLSLKYNRTRQANITNELIEIISGAEAV
ncbi:F0F1 ATP synthase subunit gamma [Saccharibacter sp. 17.LH.SD]|uniref:F0F1 ATP synthase subunit gamma n=1 Tax=Saccharibacter sp. 17.LH.SD TaxID=2689393 RepID=UPI001369E653|nr:F0F1 ATP synthase subunit gamma [Saccharibacter sp. 17.LH.SD]MXV43637.1 F0F1 ATP synthase subunit gamma [Saccharibacter sp. 17.LH.SD]